MQRAGTASIFINYACIITKCIINAKILQKKKFCNGFLKLLNDIS